MSAERSYNALIVTDDQSLPKLLGAILIPAGFAVKTVAHPALEQEVENDDYTMLVIDGDLPGPMPALESAVVVIAPRNAVDAYDLGADLVIDKPLIANIFLAKVRAVMRRYGVAI